MIQAPSFSLIENAVDKFPANIAILDASGTIIHVNDSWTSFAQENGLVDSVPAEGTDYLAVAENDPTESAQDAVAGIRGVLSGKTDTFEITYPCHSPGEKRWFTMRVAGFDSEQDRYATVVHVDITDRKEREHELELFESVFTNQIGLALMFDESGEIILANECFYEVGKRDPKTVVGTHYDDLDTVLPTDADAISRLQEMLTQVLTNGLGIEPREVDFLIGGEDTMTTDVRILPYEIDSYSNGAILTARDITKWKEREEQLRLYERAVEGATEMLSAVGPDYTYLFANDPYREFHQISDDLSELQIEDVLEVEDLKQLKERVDRVLDGERLEFTQMREGPNGKGHLLEIRYYPLRGDDGSIAGVVSAMRDMTERRERERQLFVMDRVLRHNMHNDMNIIQGYADLIAEHDQGDLGDWGEKIRSTATGLLNTVDKQRNIIELLSTAPEFNQLDIAEIAERVVTEIELTYPKAEITLDSPPTVSLKTISQIEKAIHELVENAVIHTGDGVATVDVRILDSRGSVKIEVADEGEGISEAEQGVLTGNQEIGPLYHGSGMGLWMVNWIVSRSDGSLEFRSGSSKGSIVTIELPKQ